ncbi:siroheme decarboxylase subunit beta [Desulfoferrobacter suflitae]|uniref:siroheme decarboxylase subunit beta n=1 Tax=Desulfoferrobacter suflitae TaxID=2865782 RepID=UPI0021643B92|nr:hypothetical protein [Desulfoferrobacter suflitae]MCK8600781.1 hypothetical protein [Desulfoferrobacter suflitae]
MDAVNRVILDRIQRAFPIVPKPYQRLAEGLAIDSREVRGRIKFLKDEGLVRQISAIFNTGALGYRSSLVAMAVPQDEVERAAAVINQYPGVSHNYLRPGAYNIWYTIAVPPGQSLEGTVERLSSAAGGWPALILPALKKYKLAVVLDVLEEGESAANDDRSGQPKTESDDTFDSSSANIRIVRTIQEDLPLVESPFELWANDLDMKEEELLTLISKWLDHGVIRRFAAVLNHRQVGFSANGMVVWSCPVEGIDRYGKILASHAEVSHCYHRPAYPVWPYNLYAMVHGRTMEECRRIAEKLAEAIHLHDYEILFSTREFKKIRLKLFWE